MQKIHYRKIAAEVESCRLMNEEEKATREKEENSLKEKITSKVESSRLANEKEKDKREKEDKNEIEANLEFKSIDILEDKLAKRIAEHSLMDKIAV